MNTLAILAISPGDRLVLANISAGSFLPSPRTNPHKGILSHERLYLTMRDRSALRASSLAHQLQCADGFLANGKPVDQLGPDFIAAPGVSGMAISPAEEQ